MVTDPSTPGEPSTSILTRPPLDIDKILHEECSPPLNGYSTSRSSVGSSHSGDGIHYMPNGVRRDSLKGVEIQAVNPLGLHLRSDTRKGKGVFTDRLIHAGSVIEESPVLVLTKEQWEKGKMNDSILGEYGFCWSNGGMAIGLGLASLFNHSSRPNVTFIRNPKTNTITFRSSTRINPGDELCICYVADESNLWFVDSSASPRSLHSLLESDTEEFTTFPQLDPDDFLDESDQAQRKARDERRREVAEHDAASDEHRQKREREHSRDSAQSLNTPLHPNIAIKQQSQNVIHAPQPVHFRSVVPAPTTDLPGTALSALPAPLHSITTTWPNTPPDLGEAQLVKNLPWSQDDWTRAGLSATGGDNIVSGDFDRIKGPAEIEEQKYELGTMDVYVVDLTDSQLVREVLNFARDFGIDNSTRHLKRVTKKPGPEGGQTITSIALCTVTASPFEKLVEALHDFHPSLADLIPRVHTVPKSPARTQEELKEKTKLWPVSYSPMIIKPCSSLQWSPARLAWVKAGIDRILSVALAAKDKGEVPVGIFCASPPESFWNPSDGFIPATPGLRAQTTDTRMSAAHPLRHAVLNCVRSVAHLRTIPPFSEIIPTRNGGDYLLTSMTLFITHEPCVMCSMALLHSRVKEVFYLFPRPRGGGFEGGMAVHGRKDLNHRFDVWKYKGFVDPEVAKALEIDPDTAI